MLQSFQDFLCEEDSKVNKVFINHGAFRVDKFVKHCVEKNSNCKEFKVLQRGFQYYFKIDGGCSGSFSIVYLGIGYIEMADIEINPIPVKILLEKAMPKINDIRKALEKDSKPYADIIKI